MKQVTAKELVKKYEMQKHEENGMFIECNDDINEDKRHPSGFIYYYVSPGEKTEFHKIDCDEYWSYNAGSTIELWVINLEGKLNIKSCGIGKNAEPTVLFKKGEIFASRLTENASDGCFLTCITVPRFSYDGFEIIEKENIIKEYPKVKEFWD